MSARIAAAAVAAVLGSALASVAAQSGRSAAEGVYTTDQAARGRTVYEARCSACHGASLQGAQAPPLAGAEFLRIWHGSAADLVAKVQNTMPANEPGTLTRQQAADVVAYLLQVGAFPAGRRELPSDPPLLEQIAIPAPAASAGAAPGGSAFAPSFPPAGNLAQVMRGILFPSSNLIFNVQTRDPAAPRQTTLNTSGGFPWADWGAGIYGGWEMIDYAAIALAESAPLMLMPGRRCENGKPVPVTDPEWVTFTMELAEAGRAAYRASQTRKQEVVSEVTNQVSDACFHCHSVFRDKRGPRTGPDPSNKAARCVR